MIIRKVSVKVIKTVNLCEIYVLSLNKMNLAKYSLNANHVVFVQFYLPTSQLILNKC